MSFSMLTPLPWSIDSKTGRVTPIAGASRMLYEGGQTIIEVLSFVVGEVTITADPAFHQTQIRIHGQQQQKHPRDGFTTCAEQALQLELLRFDSLRLPPR